jgi:ankyrin repeat protein
MACKYLSEPMLASCLVYNGTELGNVSSVDNSTTGRTALHLAALYNRVDCINILLEAGANPRATDNKDGQTVLHFAARYDCSLCVEPLINNGADIEAMDNYLATPMALASLNKNCATIVKLQRLNANTTHLPRIPNRASLIACENGK